MYIIVVDMIIMKILNVQIVLFDYLYEFVDFYLLLILNFFIFVYLLFSFIVIFSLFISISIFNLRLYNF
jgi:hypothetical protein